MDKLARCALLSTLFLSSSTFAVDLNQFQVNAFMSAGLASTDVSYIESGIEPVFATTIEKQPSFDKDTNVGIQVSKNLKEDVSFTAQFYAEAARDFDVEATWAFLKWEPSDSWQFRGGRVRANTYMLSDHVHIAYTYPWVRPPQEVYAQIPIKNFTGADVRFKLQIYDRDLSLTAFYGSATQLLTFPAIPEGPIFDVLEMRLRDLYSFEATYGNEVFKIRAGYQTADASLDPDMSSVMTSLNEFLNTLVGMGFLGTDYINYFSIRHRQISFAGLGYEFEWKNVVSLAEIVKRHSSTPMISDAVGWYVMGGYKVKDIMPHITFSRLRLQGNYTRRFPSLVNMFFTLPAAFGGAGSPFTLDEVAQAIVGTSTHFEGNLGDQSSVTLGVRWDVLEGVALKVEYQRVHPDRLSPGLFDFNPEKSVNVYSLALNAVI